MVRSELRKTVKLSVTMLSFSQVEIVEAPPTLIKMEDPTKEDEVVFGLFTAFGIAQVCDRQKHSWLLTGVFTHHFSQPVQKAPPTPLPLQGL